MNHIIKRSGMSLLLCMSTVFLLGCAQLSPQRITFSPSVANDELIQAQGSATITVADNRSSNVIGYRGGVYSDTSTIESKYPLTEVISAYAAQTLGQAGIEVTNVFPELDIQISIDEFTYITEDKKAGVKRSTAVASLSIRVAKGNSVFENGYRTSEYIDTFGYPSEDKNEAVLTNVFNSVIERMFSDKSLENYLAQ